jgi:hypothetical protein
MIMGPSHPLTRAAVLLVADNLVAGLIAGLMVPMVAGVSAIRHLGVAVLETTTMIVRPIIICLGIAIQMMMTIGDPSGGPTLTRRPAGLSISLGSECGGGKLWTPRLLPSGSCQILVL